MLHSIKKIAGYSARVASSTKHKIEDKVKKFAKKHKVPLKEGKKLISGIVHEIKEDAVKVGDFISNAVHEEFKKAKPFVKQGKKKVKKTAKAFAKKAFHKAKAKGKSLVRKVIKKASK